MTNRELFINSFEEGVYRYTKKRLVGLSLQELLIQEASAGMMFQAIQRYRKEVEDEHRSHDTVNAEG